MEIAREGFRLEADQVFFKGTTLRDDFSFGVENDAGSVEDQAVVAADLIHHRNRNLVLARDRGQHVAAHFAFADPERRRGNVQNNVAARAYQRVDRIHRVQAFGPEELIVPGIFADGKRHAASAEGKQILAFCRSEIAHLVEHVVSGQKHLRLQKRDFAVLQQRRRIHDGLASFRFSGSDQPADDGDAARFGRNLFGGLAIASDERCSLH